MFQILYPLGLLAAVGIAIPILIHLWNIKSGKTLKIGSVFLLGTPTNQRSRSFRVQDWPLLLIRSLLVLLIAFLLANPIYQKTQQTASGPNWILLEKASFPQIWRSEHQKIDSLIKAGYEIHDFGVNFDRIDIKDSNTVFSAPASGMLPYYALIRELDHRLAAGTSVHIFAKNQRQYFEGVRSKTRTQLQWHFLPSDTAQMHWTAAAYDLQYGGKRKLEGVRTERGISYRASNISTVDEGFAVDTTTMLVQINAGQNTSDAAYVKAALQAIASFTERKIVVEDIRGFEQIKPSTNFVFWLSDKAISTLALAKLPAGLQLFSYAGRKSGKFRSEVLDLQGLAIKNVTLYQKILDAQPYERIVWKDGTGKPVLTADKEGAITQIKFYSRFNPEWTNMVWSEQLVMFLMPLILPESSAAAGFRDAAKLPVSTEELQAAQQNHTPSKVETEVVEQELDYWVWTCLFLLFFIERWITYTKRKTAI